jgi:cellulose synthase operon protein C
MSGADTPDDLQRLLFQAYDLPYGDAKDALLEQVLRHAEAGAHTELAFHVRMAMVDAYGHGMSPAKLFVPFARCLAEYDRDPGAHESWVAPSLRWKFKTAVGAMTKFPEVPMDRALAALDQMERRYRVEGQSLNAVYGRRHRVAVHIGDLDAAAHWYERWCTTTRDENSDCEGCDPTNRVAWLASRGRDIEAVELAAPVLAGELGCSEQPQLILTELLLPYLRTGQFDEARSAHRRSYRLLRTKPQDLTAIGDHLEFCALSGNQVRGLELLDRHFSWLDRAPSPKDALAFLTSAALLLRTLVDAGDGDTVLRRPAAADRRAAESTARAMRAELTGEALAIAARFDHRNGTDHQTASVHEKLASEPIVDYLPLSAAAAHRAPAERGPAAAAVEIPELTTIELIERAEQATARHALAELRALAQRLAAEPEPTEPGPAGRRASVLAGAALQATDHDHAELLLRRAAEYFAATGEQDRRQSELGRLGLLLSRHGDAAEAVGLLRDSLSHLANSPEPQTRAAASLRLSGGMFALFDRGGLSVDDAAELPALLDRAGADAADAGDDFLLGDVARHRMYLHQNNAELADAIAAGREAVAAYRRAGQAWRVADAAQYLSGIHLDAGDPAAALEMIDEAVRLIDADLPDNLRLIVHARRGALLIHLTRHAEAVSELLTAIAAGSPQVPYAQWDLALAYRACGQLLDAADQAEEAIAGLERAGAVEQARTCRLLLVDLHRRLDEDEPALAVLDEIIEFDRATGNLGGESDALVETADLLDVLDRDAEAAERYARAAEVAERFGDPVRVAYCRYSAALSLHWTGDCAAAITAVTASDEAIAKLAAAHPDTELLTWHTARNNHNAARILRRAQRPAEALPRADAAAAGFRAIDAGDQATRSDYERAVLLIELNRPAEAEKILTEAVAELADDHAAEPMLSELLADTRAQLT